MVKIISIQYASLSRHILARCPMHEEKKISTLYDYIKQYTKLFREN